MNWLQCFSELCPSPQETFSFRAQACSYEYSLFPGQSGIEKCPFKASFCESSEQAAVLETLKKVLVETYTSKIKITLAEPSSSIVVRSEHQFHQHLDHRFPLRQHFYQVLRWDIPPGSNSPLSCTRRLCEQDLLGSYLGFVDLRMHSVRTPIAMGLLSIPQRLQADPDAYCIAGQYGPLFGGPAFPCSVFSMQDPASGGAKCAQACMIMALSILADRGARIHGSYELTYLGLPREPAGALAPPPECLVHASPGNGGSFRVEGLKPNQMEAVLKQCSVQPQLITIYPGLSRTQYLERSHLPQARQRQLQKYAEGYAFRLITAYLRARYSVILGVRTNKWWPDKAHHQTNPTGHGVVVVGYKRKSKHAQRPECLIVHDPGSFPFLERPSRHCFGAAWEYGGNRLMMVAVADCTVGRHLHDCMSVFLADQDNRRTFRTLSAYSQPNGPQAPEYDYQFVYLAREDLHTLLAPTPLYGLEKLRALRRSLGDALAACLPDSRFWCLAGYTNGRLIAAWLFNATPVDLGEPACARLLINRDGKLRIQCPDGKNFRTQTTLDLPPMASHE